MRLWMLWLISNSKYLADYPREGKCQNTSKECNEQVNRLIAKCYNGRQAPCRTGHSEHGQENHFPFVAVLRLEYFEGVSGKGILYEHDYHDNHEQQHACAAYAAGN